MPEGRVEKQCLDESPSLVEEIYRGREKVVVDAKAAIAALPHVL
jgi:hypothetical protein